MLSQVDLSLVANRSSVTARSSARTPSCRWSCGRRGPRVHLEVAGDADESAIEGGYEAMCPAPRASSSSSAGPVARVLAPTLRPCAPLRPEQSPGSRRDIAVRSQASCSAPQRAERLGVRATGAPSPVSGEAGKVAAVIQALTVPRFAARTRATHRWKDALRHPLSQRTSHTRGSGTTFVARGGAQVTRVEPHSPGFCSRLDRRDCSRHRRPASWARIASWTRLVESSLVTSCVT